MSHSIQPISQLRDYYKTSEIPTIIQEFSPRKGWIRTHLKKRVSKAWLRKLRTEGVTHINLEVGNRSSDWSIEELLRVERKPLLTGNLIGSAAR